MSEFQSQEMLEKNMEMSPIGPKTGPKSDQKAVGGTTSKTVGKTDRPEIRQESADPTPLEKSAARPSPPSPP